MQKIADQETLYALVTGGSEGIGRAIAESLAMRGYGLLIAALPDDALEAAAASLERAHGVPVHTLGVDLSLEGADLEVFNWVARKGCRIKILVNNAGYGHLGHFGDFGRDFYHNLLQLCVVNATGLTRLLLPMLQKEKESHILFAGSAASFFPVPYKTVYASSKNYLYAFSRALREEMRHTGLKISLLCPGAVLTNADVVRRIEKAGTLARLSAMSPSRVGSLAVAGMLKGRWLIVPGNAVKLAFWVMKLAPPFLRQRLLARKFKVNSGDQI